MNEPHIPRRLTDSFEAKEPPSDFASRVVDALAESALSEPQSTIVDAPRSPRPRHIPSQALWWAAGVLVGAAVTILAMRLSVQTPADGDVISETGTPPAQPDTGQVRHEASPARRDTRVGQSGRRQKERGSDATQSEASGTDAPNRPKRILDPVTTGTLILTTERPSTVFANGKRIGTTPLQKALRPGNYKVEVKSTECGDKTFRIVLGVGEVVRKSLALCGEETTPSALGKGKVRLITSPWTEVYFRGKKLGPTPDVFELPAGNQKLDLVHVESGCELSLNVQVRAGATDNKRVAFTLRECTGWRDGIKPSDKNVGADEAAGLGTLVLATSPWSEVYEGGKKLGSTPLKKKLPVGVHRLTLKNAGAECEKQILVEIKENDQTSMRLALCN